MKVKSLSRVQLSAIPWTVAHQAPQSMGFSRQEYWSGVPLPSPYKGLEINIFLKTLKYFLNNNDKSIFFMMCGKKKITFSIPLRNITKVNKRNECS